MPVFDNMDAQAEQETKREAAKVAAKRQEEAFGLLMQQEWGRNIVRALLAQSGVWRSSFNGDPRQTAFNEGRRAMGLYLLQQVQGSEFFLMLMDGRENERGE